MNIKLPYELTQESMLKVLDTIKELAPSHEIEAIANLISMPWSDQDNFDLRVSQAILGLSNLVAVCWNSYGFQAGVKEGLGMQSRRPSTSVSEEVVK